MRARFMIPDFGHHPNSHFLGFPMSQNRRAIPAWSYFFEIFSPRHVVEVGSSLGGMSCLLAIACRATSAHFLTLDISERISPDTKRILADVAGRDGTFVQLDALSEAGKKMISNIVSREGRSAILCDGGNKTEEFRTFAAFLKPGDVIAAHDFGAKPSWPWQEIRIEDVADVLEKQNLQRFMEDVFEDSGWLVCRKAPLYPDAV